MSIPFSRSRAARVQRATFQGLLVLVLGLVLLEILLQAASLFASDRAGIWRPGAHHRILCVGDSHTWGSAVSREESYPAQLQERLDLVAPDTYSVVNQGLPGMNTAQLRQRLPVWIQRYEPDTVIVWAGVNNAWNRSNVEEESSLARAMLDGLLSHSRLYRLLRVWWHDRELSRYAVHEPSDRVWHRGETREPFGENPRFTVQYDGVVEEIHHARDSGMLEREGEAAVEARSRHDYESIVRYAESAGVEIVFITYPINLGWYHVVNRALDQVAGESPARLVHSAEAVAGVPKSEQDWFADGHPGPNLYRAIAARIADVIVAGETATDPGASAPSDDP